MDSNDHIYIMKKIISLICAAVLLTLEGLTARLNDQSLAVEYERPGRERSLQQLYGVVKPDARRVYVQPVQQRAVDVLWGPQWALTECVQWGERRQWSHLRFSGAVSFLRSICRTRLEVVAATGKVECRTQLFSQGEQT